MNVTFLIGNGFDLACGLKTRYTDVYEEYCKPSDEDSDVIKKFKAEILGKEEKFKSWTDFEMALPNFGKKLNDFEKFKECISSFTIFLNEYLKEQEGVANIEENKAKLGKLFTRYIYEMHTYCLEESKTHLGALITDINQSTIFKFITFNYTNTLERCLPLIAEKSKNHNHRYQCNSPIIHIHSKLDRGIKLGLDNEKWYKDIPCEDKRKLKNLIDKLHINSRQSNITKQTYDVLKGSNIIVIFGWSMGESDSHWVNSIKKLFSTNKALNIVYVPYYTEKINVKLSYEEPDREDVGKDFIAEKFGVGESDLTRIHIITNDSYMNLRFLSNSTDKIKKIKEKSIAE